MEKEDYYSRLLDNFDYIVYSQLNNRIRNINQSYNVRRCRYGDNCHWFKKGCCRFGHDKLSYRNDTFQDKFSYRNDTFQDLILSEEQEYAIEKLKNNNIVIDSVAGSGKTTTNLYIAKQFNNLKILLLTYNARLKDETREKIKKYKLTNIEVHNYHSFCVSVYKERGCYQDSIIEKNVLNKDYKMKFNYDLIILDEVQDIIPLYFKLLYKIYNDCRKNPKICILGDRKQSIYNYKGADERFITYASKIFNFNNLSWKECKYKYSFRVPLEICKFINNCLLDEERILSKKIMSIRPEYIICNTFDNTILNQILNVYLKDCKYKPEDIFILAPSVKKEYYPKKNDNKKKRQKKNPLQRLCNLLSKNNIPVYCSSSDEEVIDEDILKNKIVFSTFHQVKGLERKVVIIYNFDDSYAKFYNTDCNENECPNAIYVATTRALERLCLVHHYENDYLPFINKTRLKQYCKIYECKEVSIKNLDNLKKFTNVTKFIKHRSAEVIDKALKYIEIKKIETENLRQIQIPTKTQQLFNSEEIYESVWEITGNAIPAYFEYILKDKKQKPTLFNNINVNKNISEKNVLFYSNVSNSKKRGLIFKQKQINCYDWLKKETLDECINRLKSLNISKSSKFEEIVKIQDFLGVIDCIDIDNNNVYEFKCSSYLKNTDFLQLALYMYLHMSTNDHEKNFNYYLFNIFTNKLFKLTSNYKNLYKMYIYLKKEKNNSLKKNDDDFLDMIKKNKSILI